MKKTVKNILTSLIAASALSIIFATGAHAATFTVSLNDTAPTVDGDCTLREAIININNQDQTNSDCPLATGDDSIVIPAGTITLISDAPLITRSMDIQGAGMGQTIVSGASQHLTAMLDSVTSGQVVISDITYTAFRTVGIIVLNSSNVLLERVEIDGSNAISEGAFVGGIGITADNSEINSSTAIKDSYIHNIESDDAFAMLAGILTRTDSGASVNLSVESTTVDNLNNSAGSAVGVLVSNGIFTDQSSGTITAQIANVTINNIRSSADDSFAFGFNDLSAIANGSSSSVTTIQNSTIRNISNTGDNGTVGGVALSGAVSTSENELDQQVNLTNTVLANTGESCTTINLGLFFDGFSGEPSQSITSSGGNLSDDNSCSSYFTQGNDQNNVTNLSSTLGELSDNGGYVPTMALLDGSPAIDNGVTIAGITTDARGTLRPQGVAYDSGAYERVQLSGGIAPIANTLADTGLNTLAILATALGIITASTLLGIRYLKMSF